jgi:hypothetical protein
MHQSNTQLFQGESEYHSSFYNGIIDQFFLCKDSEFNFKNLHAGFRDMMKHWSLVKLTRFWFIGYCHLFPVTKRYNFPERSWEVMVFYINLLIKSLSRLLKHGIKWQGYWLKLTIWLDYSPDFYIFEILEALNHCLYLVTWVAGSK